MLASGCDFFSTRDFRSKPSGIRPLPGLSRAGDSVTFMATEAVWRAGAKTPEQVLSRRRVTFVSGGDSLDGSDTWTRLTLRIREDSSGILVEEGTRLVRFSAEGVEMQGVTSGGARYFPLKTGAADSAGDAFLALPSLLIEGWGESVSMGIFSVRRLQTGVDTLAYGGRDEEAWVISESVMDGNRVASRGKYWYAASGLLKAEQTWDDFDWRGTDAAPPREGAVSLRRNVVRL